MKPILFGLCALFLYSTNSDAQVKRLFKKDNGKNQSTTVVIKESEEVDDLELLNESLDINSFSVGDIVVIATEKENQSSLAKGKKELESQRDPKPRIKRRITKSPEFTLKKNRKRAKPKPFGSKRSRKEIGLSWNEKRCPKW
ncbi:MAG: hypothetical protein HKN16_08960 [Saprospiraceae bacterium]|nr:hypothetical protein [Saprospiraceae bacterium]